MANGMIKTTCKTCGQVYELDSSMVGQTAECACGATFEIQDETEAIEQALAAQAAAAQAPAPAPEPEAAPMENGEPATHTVKISKMKTTGMLPQLQDDNFRVGTINAATQTSVGGGSHNRKFTTSKKIASSNPVAEEKKPWWKLWK